MYLETANLYQYHFFINFFNFIIIIIFKINILSYGTSAISSVLYCTFFFFFWTCRSFLSVCGCVRVCEIQRKIVLVRA